MLDNDMMERLRASLGGVMVMQLASLWLGGTWLAARHRRRGLA